MRERLVTRTIITRNHTVIGINKEDMKTVKMIIVTTGIIPEKEVTKACEKACELHNMLFTAIVAVEETEKLYGMTEAEFVRNAKELPARTATE